MVLGLLGGCIFGMSSGEYVKGVFNISISGFFLGSVKGSG